MQLGGVSKRILVIENELSIREVIRYVLTKAGFSTTVRTSETEAIRTLETDSFDLIINDVYLPYSRGFSILEFLQSNQLPTPWIAMSTGGQIEGEHIRNLCLRLGASAFIRKPFSLVSLSDTVLSILEGTHAPTK